eukprot:1222910-Prymnesium_polylepis.1
MGMMNALMLFTMSCGAVSAVLTTTPRRRAGERNRTALFLARTATAPDGELTRTESAAGLFFAAVRGPGASVMASTALSVNNASRSRRESIGPGRTD